MDEEFFDLPEMSYALCLTEEEVLRAVENGEIPKPERKGKHPKWRWSQVDRMISSRGEGTSCVYFLEMGDFIKIGYSSNVGKRIEDLSITPYEIKLLHTIPGRRCNEADLHRDFKHLRVKGEWFQKAPELLAFIEALKK